MKQATQTIPESMIYEIVDGQPIYYKGYKEVLSGKKQMEELMGSSYLQSLIISELFFFLKQNLSSSYKVLTSELGLKFEKGHRAADIAIYENKQLKSVEKNNKYLNLPPKIVIEVDTKGEAKDTKDSLGYYHNKTDQLLAFGVEKVIWYFTESRKIMVAEPNRPWQTLNWEAEIDFLEGITLKIDDLLEE